MTDLLRSGVSWLAGIMRDRASQDITYLRGMEQVTLAATVGKTTYDLVDADTGAVQQVEARDYLFQAAELILAGSVTLPQPGDLIHETVGDAIHVYQVLAPEGQTVWRYDDPHRIRLRVHTKLADAVG